MALALEKLGFSLVERGLFNPAQTNEAIVYLTWVVLYAISYGFIASKHKLGNTFVGLNLPVCNIVCTW